MVHHLPRGAAGRHLYWGWSQAERAGLVKPDAQAGISKAVRSRIVFAQTLYALGALLSLVNTYWSIGFIVLVQLNYAIAPTMKRGEREA